MLLGTNAGCSSSYRARSSGMKRCCDIRLPFKRKRQQSFATSCSSEEKWRPCCCVTGRFRNIPPGIMPSSSREVF